MCVQLLGIWRAKQQQTPLRKPARDKFDDTSQDSKLRHSKPPHHAIKMGLQSIASMSISECLEGRERYFISWAHLRSRTSQPVLTIMSRSKQEFDCWECFRIGNFHRRKLVIIEFRRRGVQVGDLDVDTCQGIDHCNDLQVVRLQGSQ